MSEDCKKEYEAFLADKNFKYVYTTAAIQHFIHDFNSGKLIVKIDTKP